MGDVKGQVIGGYVYVSCLFNYYKATLKFVTNFDIIQTINPPEDLIGPK